MFDIGASELLVIVIVAVLVIGPKEMPHALRTAGRWIGKMRKVSAHFRTGIDAMVREAELEDAEKEWQKRNAEIMSRDSGPPMEAIPEVAPQSAPEPDPADARAEAARERARPPKRDKAEPRQPLDPDGKA